MATSPRTRTRCRPQNWLTDGSKQQEDGYFDGAYWFDEDNNQ